MITIQHCNPKTPGRKAELRTFLWFGWIRIANRIHQGSNDWNACIAHEMTHWQQYRRSWGLHPLRYKFSAEYRLRSELEAYAAEYASYRDCDPGRLHQFARWISEDYDLDVTLDQSLDLLSAELAS